MIYGRIDRNNDLGSGGRGGAEWRRLAYAQPDAGLAGRTAGRGANASAGFKGFDDFAALVELMAQRLGQNPPPWAAEIGSAPQPVHLLQSASRMKRLRDSCERNAPWPLRRRLFFAPANYLEAL